MNDKEMVRAIPPKAAKKRKRSFDWSALAFVAALCLLSFLYGTTSNELNLPPNSQVRQAFYALKAFRLIDNDLPTGVMRVDPDAEPRSSVRRLDPTAGDELLLVTGGPYRKTDLCPKYGCLAWVADRSGKVVRTWPLPLDALFQDAKGYEGDQRLTNFYPNGVGLLSDGSLVATFHSRNTYPYAGGIARIGADGKVFWKSVGDGHHWLHVGPDDRIYAPVQIRRKLNHIAGNAVELHCADVVHDEGVRIYRPDGKIERTVLMADMLVRGGYPGLIYSVSNGCDPIHLNSIDVASPEVASRITGAKSGDVLVSLREKSAIVLFDPETAKVKRVIVGRTAAQHSAKFLPDGTVLAFDNQGGAKALGGSRIVRLNLVDGSVQTLFPTQESRALLPFFSETGGFVMPSPDGKRAMVSSEDQSRDFEFDLATGRPLWIMTHAIDVNPIMKKRGKPLAGLLNVRGTYYLTKDQAIALDLGEAEQRLASR